MDKDKLETYVKILTNNYQLKFREANQNPDISNIINIISRENQINNHTLIPTILKEYRPSQLLPDTIGSFLFGCLQQTYGDVPLECSPLCAYGIKDNNELEIKKCQHQIYVQYNEELNNRFFKLNDNYSKHAYLFVHLDFMGLTPKEKQFFKDNGVYKIHVLLTHNSKHHSIIKMRDIDDLPNIENFEGINYATSESSLVTNIKENDETENVYLYVIISIAMIVILAAAYNRN